MIYQWCWWFGLNATIFILKQDLTWFLQSTKMLRLSLNFKHLILIRQSVSGAHWRGIKSGRSRRDPSQSGKRPDAPHKFSTSVNVQSKNFALSALSVKYSRSQLKYVLTNHMLIAIPKSSNLSDIFKNLFWLCKNIWGFRILKYT